MKRILGFTSFRDKVITAIGKAEWEQFKWDGGGAGDKRTIINAADLVFTAAESVSAYDASRMSLIAQKVNDLLLDCSDAHHFSDTKQHNRIGNCFTWVKGRFPAPRTAVLNRKGAVVTLTTTICQRAQSHIIQSTRLGSVRRIDEAENQAVPFLPVSCSTFRRQTNSILCL